MNTPETYDTIMARMNRRLSQEAKTREANIIVNARIISDAVALADYVTANRAARYIVMMTTPA